MQNIICRITLEVLGRPQEHVDETMGKVVEKIKTEENLKVRDVKRHESKVMERNGKFYTTFTELEFETNQLKRVLEICYDYMPSNVEIVEPAGLEMDCNDIADVFNDFLAKLHRYSAVVQNLRAENVFMMKELEKIKGVKTVPLKGVGVRSEKE
jgi:hypothetical protein